MPFLRELGLKLLHYNEQLTIGEMAQRMKVPRHIVDEISRELRKEKMIQFVAASAVHYENVPIRLTEVGRERVDEALKRSRYAGPVPVTLEQYNNTIESLMSIRTSVKRERLLRSLSHLVFAPEVLERVTAALHSGRACLVYGPSGNGKTEIVSSFAANLESGTIVPHAIYTYGQLIKVFDRLHHTPVSNPPTARGMEVDERWVHIKTPVVMVGGELARDALELGHDANAGLHQLPPHLKAQNGVFIVDDFGRQAMRPEEMLNRWIVPMERSWDIFSLNTGEILSVPFDVTLVLSTNLSPADLMDEALLRRIPYKVHVPAPQPQQLWKIANVVAESMGVEIHRDGLEYLMDKVFSAGRVPRASVPRDLMRIIVDGARFYDAPARLTPESVERAWNLSYGTDSDGQAGAVVTPRQRAGIPERTPVPRETLPNGDKPRPRAESLPKR